MRRHRAWQTRPALVIGAAAGFAAVLFGTDPVIASGSWTATVSGSAIGESAVMPMGRSPTVTVVPGAVTLEWAASTFGTGREVAGYIVNRQVVGSADVTTVCTVAPPFRTCQDSPAPGQQVVYRVVPTAQLWRGPASPPSSPVTLPAPALVVASLSPTPSPSPTPSATPSPTPSPTPTPTPAPSPTPSPSPTSTPTATPTATPTPTSTPAPSPS